MRPNKKIYIVRKISGGMKECDGDGCQMKDKAVEKECQTSGSQTDVIDLHKLLEVMLFCFIFTEWSIDLDRNNPVSAQNEAVWSSVFLRSQ